mgnify:CR=1 FL=1
MNIIGGNSGVASLERTRYGLSLIEEILDGKFVSLPFLLGLQLANSYIRRKLFF